MMIERKGSKRTIHEWQLQEAKNKLSRVVEQARSEGPQTITLRGQPAAVVLSFEDFRRLTKPARPLSQFFRSSPLAEQGLDLTRSADLSREVEL